VPVNNDRCPSSIGPGRPSNPCDESVRFLKYPAQPWINALASRDGGETFDIPD
jgi:hypothetical protein